MGIFSKKTADLQPTTRPLVLNARDLLLPALFGLSHRLGDYGVARDDEFDMWTDMIDDTVCVSYFNARTGGKESGVLFHGHELRRNPDIMSAEFIPRIVEIVTRLHNRFAVAHVLEVEHRDPSLRTRSRAAALPRKKGRYVRGSKLAASIRLPCVVHSRPSVFKS